MVVVAVLMTACGGELKENNLPALNTILSGLSTLDGATTATLHRGDRPDAVGGPVASLDGLKVGINGGSLPMTITSATPFTHVVLAADGLDNYYELTLPAAVSSIELVATIRPDAPATENLALQYGLSAGAGQGDYAPHGVRILSVATGDVQVSVAWDSPTDVDLRVTDPSGEEVYFGNLQSASGGFLDLDSNPACSIDGVNNENIVWPTGGAPDGMYKVSLDYWSDCGQAETNWVVTVQSAGQTPQIFSGTFTGPSGGGVDIDSLASFIR
jgi:hypothetical protein